MQGVTGAKDGWLYQHFTRDTPKHENDYEKFEIATSTTRRARKKAELGDRPKKSIQTGGSAISQRKKEITTSVSS